jgi:aldehyde:ferredoxin oxidoreductase
MKTTLAGKTTIEGAYGGPEYETLGAFGSACGVTDLIAVAKANELVRALGVGHDQHRHDHRLCDGVG